MLTNTSKSGDEPRIRVYIAAATEAETARIAEQLARAQDIDVVGAASTRAALKEALAELAPTLDVLISDVSLEDEDVTPLISEARAVNDKLDVLIYTTQSQDATVIRAVFAGAMGYLLKGDQEDLVTSIRLIRGGGSPVSPTVTRSVLRAIHSRAVAPQTKHAATGDVMPLSQRESEILSLIAKGISFSEIGSILSISPHTVTAHIKKIYRKLQVHSRGEAVYEATCLGILTPEHPISAVPPPPPPPLYRVPEK